MNRQATTGERSSLTGKKALRAALSRCKRAFVGTGIFSFVINLLMLTGPLFMLQIYDRVLTSRSLPTLVALTVLVAGLFAFLGLLEFIRSRVMVRIGLKLDYHLYERLFGAWLAQGLQDRSGRNLQPLSDLHLLRQFLGGPGPLSLFDMPWVPVYLGIIFLFHPFLGWVATAGAFIVLSIALLNELASRGPSEEANRHSLESQAFATMAQRNCEAVAAMGMEHNVRTRWLRDHHGALRGQTRVADRVGGFMALSKSFRLFLQSAILAAGAWLAVMQEITPGTMIAASIILGRALAPVDQAIGQWRAFIAARQAYSRLATTLSAFPEPRQRISLPAPEGRLVVDSVFATPPGADKMVINGLRFALNPGDGLGVIGPSASGKSSLARLLVGLWKPVRGAVRLDGATLDQWDRTELGRHIGYLPQDVELFDGTVKDNIARFFDDAEDAEIITAAKRAFAHDMIVGLPDGYDTLVGRGGIVLSGGQRQRVALARAPVPRSRPCGARRA